MVFMCGNSEREGVSAARERHVTLAGGKRECCNQRRYNQSSRAAAKIPKIPENENHEREEKLETLVLDGDGVFECLLVSFLFFALVSSNFFFVRWCAWIGAMGDDGEWCAKAAATYLMIIESGSMK